LEISSLHQVNWMVRLSAFDRESIFFSQRSAWLP
jgi:hypothetical protein